MSSINGFSFYNNTNENNLVVNSLIATDTITVIGTTLLVGNTTLNGNLNSSGLKNNFGNTTISQLEITGTTSLIGTTTLDSTLLVNGTTNLQDLNVNGNTINQKNLTVNGITNLKNTNITGSITTTDYLNIGNYGGDLVSGYGRVALGDIITFNANGTRVSTQVANYGGNTVVWDWNMPQNGSTSFNINMNGINKLCVRNNGLYLPESLTIDGVSNLKDVIITGNTTVNGNSNFKDVTIIGNTINQQSLVVNGNSNFKDVTIIGNTINQQSLVVNGTTDLKTTNIVGTLNVSNRVSMGDILTYNAEGASVNTQITNFGGGTVFWDNNIPYSGYTRYTFNTDGDLKLQIDNTGVTIPNALQVEGTTDLKTTNIVGTLNVSNRVSIGDILTYNAEGANVNTQITNFGGGTVFWDNNIPYSGFTRYTFNTDGNLKLQVDNTGVTIPNTLEVDGLINTKNVNDLILFPSNLSPTSSTFPSIVANNNNIATIVFPANTSVNFGINPTLLYKPVYYVPSPYYVSTYSPGSTLNYITYNIYKNGVFFKSLVVNYNLITGATSVDIPYNVSFLPIDNTILSTATTYTIIAVYNATNNINPDGAINQSYYLFNSNVTYATYLSNNNIGIKPVHLSGSLYSNSIITNSITIDSVPITKNNNILTVGTNSLNQVIIPCNNGLNVNGILYIAGYTGTVHSVASTFQQVLEYSNIFGFNTSNSNPSFVFAINYVTRFSFTNTGYTLPSDLSLKTNIGTLNTTKSLNKVLALRPVYYNFITDASGAQQSIGLIAQEVEQITPAVKDTVYIDKHSDYKDENGNKLEESIYKKFLSYQDINIHLIGAIQELHTIIQSLRERIELLENR